MAQNTLATDLGVGTALAVGIGTMIGAGVFVLPGLVATDVGPLVVVAFVLAGCLAFINGLSVSELGTAFPAAGGAYHWVTRGLGPLFGSVAGFSDWLGLAVASSFYSLGFGIYLGTVLPLPPIELPLLAVGLSSVQLGALLAGTLFVGLNYLGFKGMGRAQFVVVGTLVGILLVFVIDGAWRVGFGAFEAFEISSFDGLFGAVAIVFISYLGYAKIATLGEELHNPGRTVPIAVMGSIVFVTLLYTALTTLVVLQVDLAALAADQPAVLTIADVAFGPVGIALMTVAGLLATATSVNFSVLASARITFAMGRQRLVGEWLNKLHPRFATPYRSLQVTGLLILGFILVDDLVLLAKTASAFHLVGYGLLNVALIVFRESDVTYEPAFRVPLYPVTPIAGAVCSFGLLAFMSSTVLWLTALLVVGSVVWYLVYGQHHTDDEGVLSQQILHRSEQLPDSAVAATEAARPDRADHRVMVSLANPRTEKDLLSLACSLAAPQNGTVVAVHVVTVPDQVPLARAQANREQFDTQSEALLADAKADADEFGVPIETHLIYSHRALEEVFDAADRLDVDNLVMGWRSGTPIASGRIEPAFEELSQSLPCDMFVLKDQGFDPASVVIPVADDPNSRLCTAAARQLQQSYDSTVTLLHVVDGEGKRDSAERFLADWADDHGIEEPTLAVDTGGDVETAIESVAATHSMLLIGATERGLLSRLLHKSLIFEVIETVECSVVLAERKHERSLRERLFG